MKVKLADRIGFCFGVKRAITIANSALKANRKVYSLGSIIHNSQVVEKLAEKGLATIKDLNKAKMPCAILISSHGAPPSVFEKIRNMGCAVIDTTCPFVLHAQKLASKMAGEGYALIIVGEKTHPEVKALVGFAGGRARVIKDKREAGKEVFREGEKAAVISQTTQTMANYLDVVGVLLNKGPREIRVFNTICNDTGKRIRTASLLSGTVDTMIIVGGRHSANTRRLFEVCRSLNDSYLVETDKDVMPRWFRGKRTVGIASGASTPDWVIEKVVKKIKLERGYVINGEIKNTG